MVATTGMIGDAVRRVAGDAMAVVTLMGPGVDPHLYKATQKDVEHLRTADLIFYNGLLLEGKMQEVLEKLAHKKPVIAVSEHVPKEDLRTLVINQHEIYDPHLWFDVVLWQACVRRIAESLVHHDKKNTAQYRKNADEYLSQLDALHRWVQTEVDKIPPGQRVLITSHDAFSYFGNRYGMGIRGLQGISTQADFGLKDVTSLVDLIVARGIRAIFLETSVSERSIRAVVAGVRARGKQVAIGGRLYSDAMGAAGTPEGSYIGMIRANVNTMVRALR